MCKTPFEVVKDILDILDTDRVAYHARRNSRCHKLFVRKLPVRFARRMQHACFYRCNMDYIRGHREAVHKLYGSIPSSLKRKGHDSAGALRQVFLRQIVIFVAFEPRIVHRLHSILRAQEFRYLLRILRMPLHTERKRLQSEV